MDRRRLIYFVGSVGGLLVCLSFLLEGKNQSNKAQQLHPPTPASPAADASNQAFDQMRLNLLGDGATALNAFFEDKVTVNNSSFVNNVTAAIPALMLKELRARSGVWMSPQEMALIESYLEPTDTMLEFGSGFSTLYFSQFVGSFYSVEHNKTWYNQVQEIVKSIPTSGKINLTLAEVQAGFKGWEGGFSEGTYDQFENYIEAVDYLNVKRFDKVLIDGRARRYCAEHVLKYLDSNSLVFVHDFRDREGYHEPLKEGFYKKVAEIHEGQSLLVMRPASARTWEKSQSG